MILTITLNPSVDRRYIVKDFEIGKVFRTDEFSFTPGGKGINVSKVIRDMGEGVLATGFLGGNNGKFIRDELNSLNIKNEFISISGETRNCLNILSTDGRHTEILEAGPPVYEENLEKFIKLYDNLIDRYDIICASGSLPRGVEKNIYSRLIEKANSKDKKFILDTSGETLKRSIGSNPYLIKPNKDELEMLTGITVTKENDIIKGVKHILNNSSSMVVVSLGEDGALVFRDSHMYRVQIPRVDVKNTVGSGDAMIAGFAVSLKRDYEFEYMLRYASASGIANAMEMDTGTVDMDNINRNIPDIKVTKIKI